MFGVLVVETAQGELGYLAAFSGLLDGAWNVDGFVPPVFDASARAEIEAPGEREVKRLTAQAEALAKAPELAAARDALETLRAKHRDEDRAMKLLHQTHKRERDAARIGASEKKLELLAQASRHDKAVRREAEERWSQEEASAAEQVKRLERRAHAADRLKRVYSRWLMLKLFDTYSLPNARGEHRTLRACFDGREPPSGAGDCAAPKLLAHAYRTQLRPLALAEFWWGPPPATGGRLSGNFYPPCKPRCAPLLPFMLEGLDVEAGVAFTPGARPGALQVLFEDDWLIAIDKPDGLLSVPGKAERDSVQTRLGLQPVHRLDLDTSGVLLAAKSAEAHRALQKLFLGRDVAKRYLAWLDGEVKGDAGEIDLPLRVDLDDRPRQIVDPLHGLRALTRWSVLKREAGRTLVALHPLTGRTHQLRVHAAHPRGLNAPIAGDRLYGRAAQRLLLHAETLSFVHPFTGAALELRSPVPHCFFGNPTGP